MALRLDQKTRLLAALPVFRVLEPEAVHVLAFSAKERKLAAGEQLFRIGDASDGGFVLVSGRVLLRAGSTEKMIEPGMLIGEAALISETTRPATALVEEAGSALELPRALVLQVLEAHPQSALRLRQHVKESIAATRNALRGIAV
jgi:CRP-like cAMP-binding protein